jgi:tRNA(fMet)-specific endonuclease VapC
VLALDTNTLIHFFKGAGRVAEHLLSTSPREIAIPAVVLFELEVGIARSARPQQRRRQLGELLSAVTVLPLGIEEARTAAHVRAALERAGTPIGPLDTLIAGIALAHRATLVTHNVVQFSRVPSLAVVDWF